MTEPTVQMIAAGDFAYWVTAGADIDGEVPAFNTQHLPDETVAQPFVMALDSRTSEEDDRMGGYWFSLNFNERENPIDLTDDDKEYIVEALRFALDNLEFSHKEGE